MGDDGGPLVELDQVTKSFGDNVVLSGVDLTVERGSATVIAGPSGSGKSTMLRCINGLEPVDAGEVRFDGAAVDYSGKALSRLRAEIGMVFQQFNLFPHMTALDNVVLGPVKGKGVAREQATDRARELLDVMRQLAKDGMTMIVVTHEMGFAREVCDRIVFIDAGEIVEEGPPDEFFSAARSPRAKEFVDKIIHH